MTNKIALIDMDNTLADYVAGLTAMSKGKVGSYKDIEDEVKSTPGFWENLPTIPEGFAVVDELRRAGYALHIVSKGPFRSTNAWSEKYRWCKKHIPDAKVTLTEDKSIVYGKILFDDWPDYIKSWLEWRPRGTVLMPDMPWNKDFKHRQVVRVKKHPDLDYSYLREFI